MTSGCWLAIVTPWRNFTLGRLEAVLGKLHLAIIQSFLLVCFSRTAPKFCARACSAGRRADEPPLKPSGIAHPLTRNPQPATRNTICPGRRSGPHARCVRSTCCRGRFEGIDSTALPNPLQSLLSVFSITIGSGSATRCPP